MKIFKRLWAAVPAVCIAFQTAAFQGTEVFGAESVLSSGGWYETAYVTWSDTDAENASVSYKGENDEDYTSVDEELVRKLDGSTGRVDIPGLAAGNYDISITTSANNTLTASVTVLEEDRSGYAFESRTLATDNYDGESVGAYKADGTPKDYAVIIYVTEDTKNTVTYGGYTGIGQILGNARNLSQSVPLIIRFIGEITTTTWSLDSSTKTITEVTTDSSGNTITPINYLQHTFTLYSTDTETDSSSNKYYDYTFVTDKTITTNQTSDIPSKSQVYVKGTDDDEATDTFINMCYAKAASGKKQAGFCNITLEGIGTDAVISNWGFDFRYGNSVEVKNLTFKNYPEDACSAQYFSRFWVHRCNFYRGSNDCDLTDEGDKYAGDGSTDVNEDYNVTISYNYYYGTKKTSLNGGSDSSKQYDYTYHHNYFHNCGSRLPLARYVNVHLYNNYTCTDSNFSTAQDGHANTATAISARASTWIFSEKNYYGGSVKNTIFGIDSDSSNGSGFIKSYDDSINGSCTYTSGSNILIASTRAQTGTNSSSQHSSEDTASGGYIDNFDTNSSYFYYADGATDVSYITDAATAQTDAVSYSGVLCDGVSYKDIMNTSSDDDSGDDEEEDDGGIITSEQTITVDNYKTSSYFSVENPGDTKSTTVFRITKNSTVSFTTGIDGAVVTVEGAHASSTSDDTRTLTLYDSSDDSAVTDGKITYNMGVSNSPATIPGSGSLSAGSYYLKASGDLNITSITVSFPCAISDKASLTFDTAETISSDTTYCTYFTVLANSSNTVTVESSSKTFGNALSYDYRMKSGGSTATDSGLPVARAVKFTVTGAGIVQLCGMAAGEENTRYAYVYDSDMSNNLGSLEVSSSTGETVSKLIALPSAGTYYITFEKAVNLYAVNVVVGGIKTDSAGSGYILADTTDSYIVAGITADESELTAYSELTVSVEADNTEEISTDVIYEKAVVDSLLITPAYLGDDYNYLYVVKISGSGGNTDFSYKTSLNEAASESNEEG